jgi:hypothetical protein
MQIFCLNIFPQGNTALHLFHNNHDPLNTMYDNIKEYAENVVEYSNDVPFVIPFIRNFDNISPIHLVLKA